MSAVFAMTISGQLMVPLFASRTENTVGGLMGVISHFPSPKDTRSGAFSCFRGDSQMMSSDVESAIAAAKELVSRNNCPAFVLRAINGDNQYWRFSAVGSLLPPTSVLGCLIVCAVLPGGGIVWGTSQNF